MKVKNDSVRLKHEVELLESKNQALFYLLLDLSNYIKIKYNKDMIITHLFRTDEEQQILYKGTLKKSPHQFWQACDIRSWIFTVKEMDEIVDYLNNKYNEDNYYKWTAKYHEVGNNGIHFHIQFVKA